MTFVGTISLTSAHSPLHIVMGSKPRWGKCYPGFLLPLAWYLNIAYGAPSDNPAASPSTVVCSQFANRTIVVVSSVRCFYETSSLHDVRPSKDIQANTWIYESLLWSRDEAVRSKQSPDPTLADPVYAVAVARTRASASFDRGLTLHSNFSGLL